MEVTAAAWGATIALIVGLLALDWIVHGRRPHAIGFAEALGWSLFYVAVALLFGVGLGLAAGLGYRRAVLRGLRGREEPVRRQPVRLRPDHELVRRPCRSAAEGPDDRDRHRAGRPCGVHRDRRGAAVGLLVHVPDLRRGAAGDRGAALPPPSRGADRRGQPGWSPPPAACCRSASGYDGNRIVTRVGGRRAFTPMLLVLLAIGSTDVLFAFDSIPAVFGVTQPRLHRLRAQTRSRCSACARSTSSSPGALDRLVYLSTGLAVILAFIGVKLVLEFAHLHNPSVPEISTGHLAGRDRGRAGRDARRQPAGKTRAHRPRPTVGWPRDVGWR